MMRWLGEIKQDLRDGIETRLFPGYNYIVVVYQTRFAATKSLPTLEKSPLRNQAIDLRVEWSRTPEIAARGPGAWRSRLWQVLRFS